MTNTAMMSACATQGTNRPVKETHTQILNYELPDRHARTGTPKGERQGGEGQRIKHTWHFDKYGARWLLWLVVLTRCAKPPLTDTWGLWLWHKQLCWGENRNMKTMKKSCRTPGGLLVGLGWGIHLRMTEPSPISSSLWDVGRRVWVRAWENEDWVILQKNPIHLPSHRLRDRTATGWWWRLYSGRESNSSVTRPRFPKDKLQNSSMRYYHHALWRRETWIRCSISGCLLIRLPKHFTVWW